VPDREHNASNLLVDEALDDVETDDSGTPGVQHGGFAALRPQQSHHAEPAGAPVEVSV
jgi:hypothetical protein